MDKPAKLRRTTGDATETALIKFFDEIRPISEFREKNPRIFFVPFNSRTKFSVSVHIQEDKNDKRVLLLVKGAPEKIIHYCDTILIDGQVELSISLTILFSLSEPLIQFLQRICLLFFRIGSSIRRSCSRKVLGCV
jgi:magnesium-transporting ATPase (P-type)